MKILSKQRMYSKSGEMIWMKLIENIEKYFHIKPNEYGVDANGNTLTNISVIVSPKKLWAYSMFNKVPVNMNSDLDPITERQCNVFRQGVRVTFHYRVFGENGDLKTTYTISTKPYLNNNQLFVINIVSK